MGDKKTTVTAFTSGENDASARFRIRQHIKPLSAEGIVVDEYCPLIASYAQLPELITSRSKIIRSPFTAALIMAKCFSRLPGLLHSHKSDVVWINRQLVPGYNTFEVLTKGPRIFDADDAIWVHNPRFAETLIATLKSIDIVFAGNSYLADWFSKYNKNVHIIPTGIDVERFVPRDYNSDTNSFTIGWTGTCHTIKYLYDIENILARFLIKYSNATLLVVSDSKPLFSKINPEQIRFVSWSQENEADVIQKMDVGIMPLPDNDWTRGKCSFKMLQYMACGIPVVVSPVGMNKQILDKATIGFGPISDDDWFNVLELVYRERENNKQLGKAGRLLVESEFSSKVIVKKIALLIKGLVPY